METKRINWLKLAIQALAIFVFILILVWIFPMPGKDKNNASNFNDNLTLLRDTAKSYYTVDRLPKNIGDSNKMTLQDMIDNKIIVELNGSDGKSCDMINSYVRVTKIGEQEYQLRVDLTCGNESDYILDTIGCYNVCTNNQCTCKDTTEKESTKETKPAVKKEVAIKTGSYTLYQYQKTKVIKNTSYICEDGYALDTDGRTCNKIVESSKISATKQYSEDKTLYMDAVKTVGETKTEYANVIVSDGPVTVRCYRGGNLVGDKCVITSSSSYAATASQSYTAWAYSNTIKSTTTKRDTTTTKYELTGSNSKYICPSRDNCPGIVIEYTYRVYTRSLKTTYSCPNGGNLSGTTCYTTTTDTYTPSYDHAKVYKCPSGFTSSGSGASMVCYKTVKTDDKYYCSDSTYTLDTTKNICYKHQDKDFIGYTCPAGYTLKDEYCYEKSSSIAAKKWTKCTTVITYTWNSSTNLSGWIKTGKTKIANY